MANRIRQGDVVEVRSGNDRGKRGKVLRVLPEKDRVVVEGVNFVFKHLRKSPKNPTGGRVRKEAPIHASKVQPVDPSTGRPTRVGSKIVDGTRVRVGRRSGNAWTGAAGGKE